jgi:prephenate dehydrogenase
MWTDILLHNADAVVAALASTELQVAELRGLLDSRNAAGLRSYLTQAQAFRRGIER